MPWLWAAAVSVALDTAPSTQKGEHHRFIEPESYANAIQIHDCVFSGQKEVAIQNAGKAWLVSGCTFEPLSSQKSGAYKQTNQYSWGPASDWLVPDLVVTLSTPPVARPYSAEKALPVALNSWIASTLIWRFLLATCADRMRAIFRPRGLLLPKGPFLPASPCGLRRRPAWAGHHSGSK